MLNSVRIEDLPPLRVIDFPGEVAIYTEDEGKNIPPDILEEMKEEEEEDGYL